MKHVLRNILCVLALATALGAGAAARAEAADLPEWTVMLYMCGSDLESQHGLGTYNLNDIASMWLPGQLTAREGDSVVLKDWRPDQVNVVVETGGARAWHGMEPDEDGRTLGVDIATDRLQRYVFDVAYSEEAYGYVPTMSLADERPLASMGVPGTLSDFIRWAAGEYPAKKYALVLWDHGGGSRTGLFVDELFDNDILYLYELGEAMADGGVRFEMVDIDACLMCSIETASMLAPYANFMVASEEVAAGYGSAFSDWLLEMYRNPGCDGGKLGSDFCDATLRKYAALGNTLEETQMTFSVIELDLIDEVIEAFDQFMEYAGLLYEQMPDRFNALCNTLIYSERYGVGGADMIDMGSFLYDAAAISLQDPDCRNALASALEDAVYYTVRGSGRSASEGLSFCYAPEMSSEEMDIYARNCPSAPYLALLDAMNDEWEAPDWVYERTRRLTQIEDFGDYRMEWELMTRNGLPAVRFLQGDSGFQDCMFRLYRMDEDSGDICLMGMSDTLIDWDDEGNLCFMPDPPTMWPTIEGQLCSVELLINEEGVSLYNVPVQLRDMPTNLRVCSTREFEDETQKWLYSYQAMGLWEGYDEDTRMPSRAIISLYEMEGREFSLLYPCCGPDGVKNGRVWASAPLTMYRSLDIKSKPLPEGTYYIGFQIKDIFGHNYDTALTELTWDGNAFTLVN
ncbi:MAG: hypothetical protein IJH09_06670 [Clostridia bacterium]|nr:hypothetical protein [Clostridia bacterium]